MSTHLSYSRLILKKKKILGIFLIESPLLQA